MKGATKRLMPSEARPHGYVLRLPQFTTFLQRSLNGRKMYFPRKRIAGSSKRLLDFKNCSEIKRLQQLRCFEVLNKNDLLYSTHR